MAQSLYHITGNAAVMDISLRAKLGIGALIGLLVIAGGAYAFVPAVQASVNQSLLGVEQDVSNETEIASLRAETPSEYGSFTYTIRISGEGKTREASVRYDATRQRILTRGGASDVVYTERDGNVLQTSFLNRENETVGLIPSRGEVIEANSNGTATIITRINEYDRTLTKVEVRSGLTVRAQLTSDGIKYQGNTFRKTGERTYNGQRVSVYKTTKRGNSLVIGSPAVMYVDVDQQRILYADGKVRVSDPLTDDYTTASLSIKTKLQQNVTIDRPAWVSRVTEYEMSDAELMRTEISASVTNGSLDYVDVFVYDVYPEPQAKDEPVTVTIRSNGTVVASEEIKSGRLYNQVFITGDSVVENASVAKERNALVPADEYTGTYTVTLEADDNRFAFANLSATDLQIYTLGKTAARQDATITANKTHIKYEVGRVYSSVGGSVTVQYANQTKRLYDDEARVHRYPRSPLTATFNRSSNLTHVSVIRSGSLIRGGSVILSPIDQTRGDVGGTRLHWAYKEKKRYEGFDAPDYVDVESVAVYQDGERLTKFSTGVSGHSTDVSAIPTGKTRFVITFESGDTAIRTVDVEEGTLHRVVVTDPAES